MKYLFTSFIALLLLTFIACGNKNKMVLDTDEMASLMADIHVGEAVVDQNHGSFPSDSSRMALKQSIYKAHGVTREQVESSFVWYGHHIEDYMKVYDKTIQIIQQRQKQLLATNTEQVMIAGDSVDIWSLPRNFEFSSNTPTNLLTFSIPLDSNWRDRDLFSLRYRITSSNAPVTTRMLVEYADGSVYMNTIAGKNRGNVDLTVRVDSANAPRRIIGYIKTNPTKDNPVKIDSIALVRMREYINDKYFSMKQFAFGQANFRARKNQTDSTSANTLPSVDNSTRHTKSTAGEALEQRNRMLRNHHRKINEQHNNR